MIIFVIPALARSVSSSSLSAAVEADIIVALSVLVGWIMTKEKSKQPFALIPFLALTAMTMFM